MILFEKIKFEGSDKKILLGVKSYHGNVWSSGHSEIISFRDRLLVLQKWRCVYCQSPIERDANGYRELDHILPKKPTKAVSKEKGESNDIENRRITFGYKNFTYEPRNLVVACKECNTQKGTFDALRERNIKRIRYPAVGHFLWYHPHYQKYSEHICLNDDFTFTAVSDEGGIVIEQCGMADSIGLERRFLSRAKSLIEQHDGCHFKDVVQSLAQSIKQRYFGKKQAIEEIMKKFSIAKEDATLLIDLWVDHLKSDDLKIYEKAIIATRIVAAKLT